MKIINRIRGLVKMDEILLYKVINIYQEIADLFLS